MLRHRSLFWIYMRRRLTPIRLLCGFVLLTIFLTAYLYDLIEIDSEKVVFKIKIDDFDDEARGSMRSKRPANVIKNRADHDAYALPDNQLNDKPLNARKVPKTTDEKTEEEKRLEEEAIRLQIDIDKNLSRLFFRVERFNYQIKNALNSKEIENLFSIKKYHENLINERNRAMREQRRKEKEQRLKEEEKAQQNEPVNDNAQNTNPADNNQQQQPAAADAKDDDYSGYTGEGKVLINQLSFGDSITRELLVKFLQLEKHRLYTKIKTDNITSVRTLINQLVERNELDYNDLPNVWKKYFLFINELQLYNNTEVLNEVLKSMATSPIVSVNEREKGTQIKMILLLDDGTEVLVKPMRVPRTYETPPDHFYFVDFERHHAEIAAFHLDKLLGFYRIPPTVGRLFNITQDLWAKSDVEFAKTFFYSPAGNTCFTGHCSYYCDTTHAICGRPRDKLEGSVQLLLPSKPVITWKVSSHPYRRSYNKKKKADWELNENYCNENVFQDVSYHSKVLLDLMDMSAFDFLTGNMDRHHYERLISLSNDTFSIHLDNGRSFGKANYDEMSILEPIRQCCLFRYSTFLRLKHLYKNKFSKLFDESMKSDPLYPILTEDHLKAIDRRTVIIFGELNRCIDKHTVLNVLVDDGY